MNAQDLELQAREFFAAEYERDGKPGAAEHIRTQPLLPNKARAVRAIAAALQHQPKRSSWWTRCTANTSLDDANAEIGFMREDWQKVGEALGFTHFVDPETIIAVISWLRRYPTPVDLEQFREAVKCWGSHRRSGRGDPRVAAEAKRLLSIIDSAQEVQP